MNARCRGAVLVTSLLVVLAALSFSEPLRAAARPAMSAVSTATEPVLDGDVLGEPVWEQAQPATDFVQTRPFAGSPASERTEVRMLYTATHLWVGVVCFDEDPAGIIVADSRRDSALNETDSFQMILDTFRDGQNGFVFGTNPAGIEYDGQVVRGGVGAFGGAFGGGGLAGGTVAGFNLNWDGAWRVAARRGDYGWSAEFAIPFRTLRYPQGARGGPQSWGVNFQRNIRRRNEVAFWSELEQNFSLDRVADAGVVDGISPPAQRNLALIPYVLGEGRRPSDGERRTEDDFEAGLDLKYGVTPSLTLDATINTDFAQVEVDEQQVNLDRFNLFFPEKRPFFLENAGFFAVGASATGSRAAAQADLFFSRRIGLGPGGVVLPIDFGVRLSGKAGSYNLGFLDMQTAEAFGLQANNYAVARVSRELPNRSSVGVLLAQREGVGDLAPDGDRNRTFAVDGQWGIGEFHDLKAFVAETDTPGLEGDDRAYHLRWDYGGPKWRGLLNYLEAEENFNPEVGFLSREAFVNASGFVMRVIRPQSFGSIQELRPHVSYGGVWNQQGDQESEYIHLDNHWEWRNGYEVHTGVNLTQENVFTPFEIAPGIFVQPGEYSHEEGQLVFITNQGAALSYSNQINVGGFFGGDRISISNTVRARIGEKLTSQLGWSYNDVDLPVGDFEVNLAQLRLSYSITPRILVQSLLQYNDRTDTLSTNVRFSWLQDANTGLYVVYNELDEFGVREVLPRPDRSLVIKYSYLFDVFGRGR